MGREPARLVLGIDQLPIHGDIEDAAAALDQLRLDSRSLLDRVRQTGGVGEVVSLHAVCDRDVHRVLVSLSNHSFGAVVRRARLRVYS